MRRTVALSRVSVIRSGRSESQLSADSVEKQRVAAAESGDLNRARAAWCALPLGRLLRNRLPGSDQTASLVVGPPFFSRMRVAVRCVLRWVVSIINVSVSPPRSASSRSIRAKMPVSLPLPGNTFGECVRGGASNGCKASSADRIRQAHPATVTHCD